jgi:acetoin utilization deacetylase AcuC-like enzyme
VFPRLIKFKPDFILISAGFDAHEKDHIHAATDTRITEFEYRWVTEEILKIANKYC